MAEGRKIRALRDAQLTCKSWQTEAARRMLMNNPNLKRVSVSGLSQTQIFQRRSAFKYHDPYSEGIQCARGWSYSIDFVVSHEHPTEGGHTCRES